MCYHDNARPPTPPRVTGSGVGADVLLSSSDGTQFMAYLAAPEHPAATAAVLLPDARGLNPFYRELTLRFAQTGMVALAIDFFGRSAGVAPRAADFDFEPHLRELRRETMLRDVAAAVGYLRERGPGPVFAIGFCMGGGTALLAGTTELQTQAGVPHEVVIYPGEPHGFLELHHMGDDGHQAVTTDAWKRLLSFLDNNATVRPAQ